MDGALQGAMGPARDAQITTGELVKAVLSVESHWEQDLSKVSGLVEQVTQDLDAILRYGIRAAVQPLC